MPRVAREFEDLILAARQSVSTQRPAACALLDNLVEKTKRCFADQKRIHYWSLAYQTAIPALGLVAPLGGSALASATTASWAQTLNATLAASDASTRLQWSSKLGDFLKSWNDAKGFDSQASQKQIDNTTAEITAVNQGQATFLQNLESALQRLQQIQDNAKR